MKYVLDTNLLVALAWDQHEHHEAASLWFATHARHGWASCAISQTGMLRLLCNAGMFRKAGFEPMHYPDAWELVQHYINSPKHHYLNLDFDYAQTLSLCTGGVRGGGQITDALLLALAIRNNCKFVTFDRGVPSLLKTQIEREKYVILLSK